MLSVQLYTDSTKYLPLAIVCMLRSMKTLQLKLILITTELPVIRLSFCLLEKLLKLL